MWHAGQRMGATTAHILETMGALAGSAAVEQLRQKLLEGAQRRDTITATLQRNASLVQPMERALLVAGEETGGLEQALNTLASHYNAEQRMLLKVWAKLTYPLVTSFVACLIAPLPLLVQGKTGVYLLSAVTTMTLWYLFGGAVIVALAARYANRREFVLARLARGMASAVEAGLTLDRAAVLAADSSGHPQVIAHVRRLPARTIATQPLSVTFVSCPLVPPEMIAAMKVAELSGDFTGSLRKLAELYDDPR